MDRGARGEKVAEHQIAVRIPAELRDALYARATEEDRPISRVIRSALRHYLLGEEGVSVERAV